jgi:hypothetical protein
LRQRGIDIRGISSDLSDIIGDRIPVNFSGSSNFGRLPTTETAMRAQAREIVARLDVDRSAIFTGGTDVGVERFIHEEANKRGIPVVGFIHEGANPAEISAVRNVVLAGSRNQWLDPLLVAMNAAHERGGMAIFMGGGGTVADGIRAADEVGIRHTLMRRWINGQDDGGASAVAAANVPEALRRQRTFMVANDLEDSFRDLGILDARYQRPASTRPATR